MPMFIPGLSSRLTLRSHPSVPRAAGAFLLAAGAALSLSGCDSADASSVKIKLRADLAGEVTTSSVGVREAGDGPAQRGAQGVRWQGSGSIIMARGEFDNINQLNVAGITFRTQTRPAGSGGTGNDLMLSVTIPRGPGVTWPAAFTVPDAGARTSAAKALNPAAAKPTMGDAVRIQIEVPGTIVTAGADVRAGGVVSGYEQTIATLTIPVEASQSTDGPITWHITWKEPTVR